MISIAFDDSGQRIASCDFQYPDSELPEKDFEVERRALAFYESLVLGSRTLSAAKMRVMASKVILGHLSVKEAASLLKTSERHVFRAVEELRHARGLR